MFHYQNKNNLLVLPGLVLFFFILSFPTSFYTTKIVLLAIVLFEVVVWSLLNNTLLIKRKWIYFVLFIEIVSALYIALGVFYNAPGAFQSSTVFLAWPIVYLLLFSMLFFENVLSGLVKIFILSLLFISIYSFSYIGHQLGILPDFLYIEFDLGQSIGFYNGFMEYRLYSLNSLIFLIPFCMSGILIWSPEFYNKIKISKKILLLTIFLSLISAVLSGRRGLWLSITIGLAISLVLYFTLMKKNRNFALKKIIKYSFIFLLIIIIGLPFINQYIDLSVSSLIEKFNLDMGYEREAQLQSLIDGWMQRPFFGNGLGSVASVIRSEEMPWAYELQYIDLLFKTGMVGFIIYSLSGIYVMSKLIIIARKDDNAAMIIIPLLTGTLAFLIANATNPYLLKFDYIWILILPIGVINHYSLNHTNNLRKGEKEYGL